MVPEILSSVKNNLHDIVFDQSVLDDSTFDVSRIIPSRDMLLLPWIYATRDGNPLALPAFDEIKPWSSLRPKQVFETPPRRSSKHCKTSTTRTCSDATRASSDDMPVIDLECDRE